jgi:methionyl-tRNA formyltransferase
LRLTWDRSAAELERIVRLGRAWTTFRSRRLIVERARVVAETPGGGREAGDPRPGTLLGDEVVCGDGRLELLEVRPEGRSVRAFDAWRRGARPEPGERLGT